MDHHNIVDQKNPEGKKSRLPRFRQNNSGIILLTVLWTLVVLTTLAISLGRQTHVELTLAKHSVGKLKSKYLAWAGLIWAIEQVRQDGGDEASLSHDILYFCGIPLKEGAPGPEELFAKNDLPGGHFSLSYVSEGSDDAEAKTYYGLQDEERRLNINGITAENKDIFISLVAMLGHDEKAAETIALAIIDWKDEDSMSTDSAEGAEDEYYTNLETPYHCKNHPFDTKEELLLVKGMTPEIYAAIAPFITVFPKTGEFKVNFDTASGTVLKAMAYAVSGPVTGTETSDADSLVTKMLDFRAGEDGVEFTADDQVVDLNQMSVTAKERVLFLVVNQFRALASQYLEAQIVGFEEQGNIRTRVQAVIQREDLSIVSWRRQ